MNRGYAIEMRIAALEYLEEGNSKVEASKIFKVSTRTLFAWEKKRQRGESLEPKIRKKPSNKPKIEDEALIVELLEKNPHQTRRDLARAWEQRTGKTVSERTIGRALKKLEYTFKKSSTVYRQANPEEQKKFQEKIAAIPAEKLVFIDETGIENTEHPLRGWSKKGERLIYKKRAFATEKYNLIGALQQNKIIHSMCFQGSCNKQTFAAYMLDLISKADSECVFICDNASFHKITNLPQIQDALLKKNAKLFSYHHILQN